MPVSLTLKRVKTGPRAPRIDPVLDPEILAGAEIPVPFTAVGGQRRLLSHNCLSLQMVVQVLVKM